MVKYYSVNGEIVESSKASLLVNDLSILRGYGIFDFFLAFEGKPLFFDDYLSRFRQSAEKMGLDMPFGKSDLKEKILELIGKNEMQEAGIRLVLTGGYALDGYTPLGSNLLILIQPLPAQQKEKYENGAKLILHTYQREIPEVKTINYITGIWLRNKIKEAGAIESLYESSGYIRECARSNVFFVFPNRKLVTPGKDILFGITRKQILHLAEGHYEIEEREIHQSEIRHASEVFITGTLKSVLPIVAIDDVVIGDGKPGPVAAHLAGLFAGHVKNYLEQH